MNDRIDLDEDDPRILAGELALGVLEGEELARARRLQLEDRDFAREVECWEYRLGGMSEAAGQFAPSSSVWPAILARIDAEATERPEALPLPPASRWNLAALAASAIMALAGVLFFLAAPRTPVPQPQQQPAAEALQSQLVVQLRDEQTGRSLVAAVGIESGRLALRVADLKPGDGQRPELWAIPEGGTPVSLGPIPSSGSFKRALSEAETRLLVPGSTLAVTFEDDLVQRHESPTLPILLSGPLDRI
ncbi:anti-sigma factor [Qipengyuania spongiae]|uniref:Anti-sigma factor n=1 Tax=Qipengyuania spongiae TaxID=2909673 RepID=A0ABY5T3H9_9SPHN|nr:anti-sigma factor [Qipengyuania spongiae]UVI39544.1 anti-sigma factor [Qipengyuania spongiae]